MIREFTSYRFGPFHLDARERLLLREGHPVSLTPKAFDTLLTLVSQNGRLVDKDTLMSAVWPDTAVEESTITQNVFTLRKTLSNGQSSGISYIETVPKRGYRFVGDVTKLPNGTVPTKEPVHSAAILNVKAIAVLPFKMISEGGEKYLGLGMADALITKLSSIQQITTRSTNAVLKYSSVDRDVTAIGRELSVEAILDGHIQRSRDRIRVTAQLINVPDRSSIWAAKFDGRFTDIFSLQDSISEQIVAALSLKLSGEERNLLTKRYTDNADAYQLYLQGRYFWNKRTEESLHKSIKYFNRATEIDVNYALAYTGLAESYVLFNMYSTVQLKDSFAMARSAAENALKLDESLAEAHTALALVKEQYEWDWKGAEREFRRAIELKPNYATAHQWYSECLAFMGRTAESIFHMERAYELDPLSPIIATQLAFPYFCARMPGEALKHLNRALKVHPDFPPATYYTARTNTQRGMFEDAIAGFRRGIRLGGKHSLALAGLAYACAMVGKRGQAQRILKNLTTLSEGERISPYVIATIHSGLGQKDAAFDWLEKAASNRDDLMVLLRVDHRLDSLRSDPRFKSLLRRAGLAGGFGTRA